ncbi:MAG: DUF4270 domain-containing protein [Candidatus Kapabacteria bacterium]|nr:DUF4270 domain-containing protein [Candidatus Kapabacteria bacterium]
MTRPICLRLFGWLGTLALCLSVISCNDAPSIVGSELIPGTDTLYTASTATLPLLSGDTTTTSELPLVNSSFVLLGSTRTADARMFVEILRYPAEILGDSSFSDSTFDVSSANLQLFPQGYAVGDTADKLMSFKVYELKKFWFANVTWDSVWNGADASEYYSTADKPIATYSEPLPSIVADSTVINIPFDQSAVKRWLVASRDTAKLKTVYGFVIVPTNMKQIRQFRNSASGAQKTRLRVITRSRRDTTTQIYSLESTVASFVNDAEPPATSLTIQGSRNVKFQMTVRLDSIPANAVIMGGDMRLTLDQQASVVGTSGRDQKISLRYQPPTGQPIVIESSADSSGTYRFRNIGPLIDVMLRSRKPATLTFQATGGNEFWAMNRLVFHGTTASEALRPRLTMIYTIPPVKK